MNNIILSLMVLLFSMQLNAAITPDGEYELDKDHAHIGFKVSHLGFSFVVGRFNDFDGTVKFNASGESKVDFTIQTESIDTNNKKRDKHLKSEDFFEADLYDEITFVSNKVTYTQGGDPETITGELDLHGETQEVTFAVKVIGAGENRGNLKAGYQASTTIDRTKFAMDTFAKTIGKEVEITVNLEIQKK